MSKEYTVAVGGGTPKNGMNVFKKVWNIVSVVIVVLAVLMAVLLVGTRVIGLRPLTVLSGSMEPEIKTGSLVYVKEVDTTTLEVGDVITYTIDANGTYATHRIIEVIPEGMTLDAEGNVVPIDTSAENYVPNKVKITNRFRTKGDNNDMADATPVADVNVVGKVQFSIPLLGYVSNYIQNPPGTYIAISVGALLILLVFLPDLLFEDDSKKKKNAKNKETADAANAEAATDEAQSSSATPEASADTAAAAVEAEPAPEKDAPKEAESVPAAESDPVPVPEPAPIPTAEAVAESDAPDVKPAEEDNSENKE